MDRLISLCHSFHLCHCERVCCSFHPPSLWRKGGKTTRDILGRIIFLRFLLSSPTITHFHTHSLTMEKSLRPIIIVCPNPNQGFQKILLNARQSQYNSLTALLYAILLGSVPWPPSLWLAQRYKATGPPTPFCCRLHSSTKRRLPTVYTRTR